LRDANVRAEMIGIDPVWQRIVLPSTALLRLGIALALIAPGIFQAEILPQARLVVVVLAALYLAAYVAVWAGFLAPAALGLSALVDTFLAGVLIAGAGPLASLAGFVGLLALAVAHMCGGFRLALAALAAGAAGWFGAAQADIAGLLWSGVWSPVDFRLGLEAETTYRGHGVLAATEHQVLRAAVASLLLVSLGGCLAFLRAQRERTRVLQACARVDALEAIVDCRVEGTGEPDFWRAVSRAASLFSGERVLAAYVEEGVVRLEEDGGQGDVLSGLRVPLAARDNPIVQGIETGREIETDKLVDLTAGAEGGAEMGRTPRRTRYVVAPIEGTMAALVAVTRHDTRPLLEALRVVAERAARVHRAWPSGGEAYELEPAGA
jgi:hypothetical protein